MSFTTKNRNGVSLLSFSSLPSPFSEATGRCVYVGVCIYFHLYTNFIHIYDCFLNIIVFFSIQQLVTVCSCRLVCHSHVVQHLLCVGGALHFIKFRKQAIGPLLWGFLSIALAALRPHQGSVKGSPRSPRPWATLTGPSPPRWPCAPRWPWAWSTCPTTALCTRTWPLATAWSALRDR